MSIVLRGEVEVERVLRIQREREESGIAEKSSWRREFEEKVIGREICRREVRGRGMWRNA